MIMKIFLITIQVVSFEYSNLRLEHRRLNRWTRTPQMEECHRPTEQSLFRGGSTKTHYTNEPKSCAWIRPAHRPSEHSRTKRRPRTNANAIQTIEGGAGSTPTRSSQVCFNHHHHPIIFVLFTLSSSCAIDTVAITTSTTRKMRRAAGDCAPAVTCVAYAPTSMWPVPMPIYTPTTVTTTVWVT